MDTSIFLSRRNVPKMDVCGVGRKSEQSSSELTEKPVAPNPHTLVWMNSKVTVDNQQFFGTWPQELRYVLRIVKTIANKTTQMADLLAYR